MLQLIKLYLMSLIVFGQGNGDTGRRISEIVLAKARDSSADIG